MDEMLRLLASPEAWVSLATLSALEVVLGVDNVIFISIMAARLPPEQRDQGRRLGLVGAVVSRLVLLCFASWIVTLDKPLATFFEWTGHPVPLSGKAVILLLGGLFLIFKGTKEIHDKLEGSHGEGGAATAAASLASVVGMIMVIDIVFSIDSVITAVGMARELSIMIAANLVALAVMLLASRWLARFVEEHPSIKMLALSFLLLIGFSLVAEGLGFHIPKGYLYFSMGFSVFVEVLNIRLMRKAPAVPLRGTPPVGLKRVLKDTLLILRRENGTA
jgi:predicted tellurium resistance membrane protein TerC